MAESLDVWHDRLPFSETLSGSLEGVCRFDSRSCQTLGVPRQSRGFTLGNYRKQESLDSQVLDFPIHDFRILPRRGNFATELSCPLGGTTKHEKGLALVSPPDKA